MLYYFLIHSGLQYLPFFLFYFIIVISDNDLNRELSCRLKLRYGSDLQNFLKFQIQNPCQMFLKSIPIGELNI